LALADLSFFLCKQAITLKPAAGEFNTLTKPGKTGQRDKSTKIFGGLALCDMRQPKKLEGDYNKMQEIIIDSINFGSSISFG